MESQWVAAYAAVTAAVVGPMATVCIAKRQALNASAIARSQISATLVSGNRQAWIDKLRDSIAEFQALLYGIGFRGGHQLERGEEEERVQRGMYLRSRVALFINPIEHDHQHLLRLMDRALSDAYVSGAEGARLVAKSQIEITEVAQRLLKREWERVKAGESTNLVRASTPSAEIVTRQE